MMQTIDQILIDIAPEMASVPEATRQRLIEYAALQVNFGSPAIKDLATAYLVAHQYAVSQKAGAAGAVTSETEGDLSRSYGGSLSESPYGASSYGQEFERLMRMFIFKPLMRTM